MNNIELMLPFPPTINSYYQVVGRTRGVKRISKAGLAFRNSVAMDVHEQLGAPPFLTYPLSLTCILYPPDKRTRDLDNYMKALLDALTCAKVWEDDSLIDQHHIYRGIPMHGGLVHVRIDEAGPVLPRGAMPFISRES